MSGHDLPDYPDLPDTDAEADRRFQMTKSHDPFPEIPASLLNSADVYDYIRLTGMLHPFKNEELKSASYEAPIKGRCIWWDEKGEKHERILAEPEDDFTLLPNSIAFVQVEPYFRLPDYIALRFNLKITHVHRGILLGTGPLVDPGFEGRLLIPLHNLTTNPYQFRGGDGLIWIEFTKTSPLPGQATGEKSPKVKHLGTYKPFPDDKKNLEPDYYLWKASPYRPIRSSIPEAIEEGRDSARLAAEASEAAAKSAGDAAERANSIRSLIYKLSLAGAIASALALTGLVYTTWTLIQDTWKIAREAREQLLQGQGSQLRGIEERVRALETQQLVESQRARQEPTGSPPRTRPPR